MYKIINANCRADCAAGMNELEKQGFCLVRFEYVNAGYGRDYVVVMHKPDTVPVPHMTTEQYLAARTLMERLADTADEVLREEARQYGDGK